MKTFKIETVSGYRNYIVFYTDGPIAVYQKSKFYNVTELPAIIKVKETRNKSYNSK